MPKTKPKRQGISLLEPTNDKVFFDSYLKRKIDNRYSHNRFLYLFSKYIYGEIKGTRDEKFKLLSLLLLEIHGYKKVQSNIWYATKNPIKEQIRKSCKVMAMVITLLGEKHFVWNDLDGYIYSKSTKEKLTKNKTNLLHIFEQYIGELNSKEQERLGNLFRPIRTWKDTTKPFSRKSRANPDKPRRAWNKGLEFVKPVQLGRTYSFQKVTSTSRDTTPGLKKWKKTEAND